MEFLTCFKCCMTRKYGKNPFLLTNCGHVFCTNCATSQADGKCVICNTKYPAILSTQEPLDPRLQKFHIDIALELEKLSKSAELHVTQLRTFQGAYNYMIEQYKKNKQRVLQHKHLQHKLQQSYLNFQHGIETVRKKFAQECSGSTVDVTFTPEGFRANVRSSTLQWGGWRRSVQGSKRAVQGSNYSRNSSRFCSSEGYRSMSSSSCSDDTCIYTPSLREYIG